jgi:hypothetical protein
VLAFWGIELMRSSDHHWLWFVPMLFPMMSFHGWEFDRKDQLGRRDSTTTGFHEFAVVTIEWLLLLFATLGFYLMYSSPNAWYWFTPLVVGGLVILPGKIEDWNEAEDRRSAEKQAGKSAMHKQISRPEPSSWGKAVKWIFVLALAALVWYLGGYYLLVWMMN